MLEAFSLPKSKIRLRILKALFASAPEPNYLSELARRAETSPGNVQRELERFIQAGLVREERKGHLLFYRLNSGHALYPEVRSLVLKAGETAAGPCVYIVAGPNGSGKTTFAKRFLPAYADCREFVNADLIAGGLSPLSPEAAQLQAGRLLVERVRMVSRKGSDFSFETTLSGKTFIHLLRDLRGRGYAVHLFFLWIPDIALSLKRIEERVKRGGHGIPEPVVRRRFHKGIRNLFRLYRPLLDSWLVFDNSGALPHLAAYEAGGERKIFDNALFDKITRIAEAP